MIYQFLGTSYEESSNTHFTHEIEYTQEQFEDFISKFGNEFVTSKVNSFEPDEEHRMVTGHDVYNEIIKKLSTVGFKQIIADVSAKMWLWNSYSDDTIYDENHGYEGESRVGVHEWDSHYDDETKLNRRIWDGFIIEREEE